MESDKRLQVERLVSALVGDMALGFFRNQEDNSGPISRERAEELYLLCKGMRNFLLAYARFHDDIFTPEARLELVS
jgi:hypothetical protein